MLCRALLMALSLSRFWNVFKRLYWIWKGRTKLCSTRFSPSRNGLYWVFLCFTGFYWVSMGFVDDIELEQVFKRFIIGFRRIATGSSQLRSVVLGFTGFNGVWSGCTPFYPFVLGIFTEFRLGFTGFCGEAIEEVVAQRSTRQAAT